MFKNSPIYFMGFLLILSPSAISPTRNEAKRTPPPPKKAPVSPTIPYHTKVTPTPNERTNETKKNKRRNITIRHISVLLPYLFSKTTTSNQTKPIKNTFQIFVSNLGKFYSCLLSCNPAGMYKQPKPHLAKWGGGRAP